MVDNADCASELEEFERRLALAAMDCPRPDGVSGLMADIVDCEKCGAPIGAERLNALPDATLCIECAQLAERRRRAFR